MSGEDATQPTPHFTRIGLIVTGHGEANFLPQFFRSLMESRKCHFEVFRRTGQRSPRTARRQHPPPRVVGTTKAIPQRDVEEIALPARTFLKTRGSVGSAAVVMVIDDLESSRRNQHREVFQRYREALDSVLKAESGRVGVFFFVNMLEAYYFADAAAINTALGLALNDHVGDVESIPHPKNELITLFPRFDEVKHGADIVRRLRLPHILAKADTCPSLRTMFAWCSLMIGEPLTGRYALDTGIYCPVTGSQLRSARCPPV